MCCVPSESDLSSVCPVLFVTLRVKFLFQGDLRHFLAVLKAHSDFYVNFSKMTKKRIEKSSKFTYFDVKSIVFEYFALKKTTYKKLI